MSRTNPAAGLPKPFTVGGVLAQSFWCYFVGR